MGQHRENPMNETYLTIKGFLDKILKNFRSHNSQENQSFGVLEEEESPSVIPWLLLGIAVVSFGIACWLLPLDYWTYKALGGDTYESDRGDIWYSSRIITVFVEGEPSSRTKTLLVSEVTTLQFYPEDGDTPYGGYEVRMPISYKDPSGVSHDLKYSDVSVEKDGKKYTLLRDETREEIAVFRTKIEDDISFVRGENKTILLYTIEEIPLQAENSVEHLHWHFPYPQQPLYVDKLSVYIILPWYVDPEKSAVVDAAINLYDYAFHSEEEPKETRTAPHPEKSTERYEGKERAVVTLTVEKLRGNEALTLDMRW
jgi:hypothetical protein